jgi:hypothetical protein
VMFILPTLLCPWVHIYQTTRCHVPVYKVQIGSKCWTLVKYICVFLILLEHLQWYCISNYITQTWVWRPTQSLVGVLDVCHAKYTDFSHWSEERLLTILKSMCNFFYHKVNLWLLRGVSVFSPWMKLQGPPHTGRLHDKLYLCWDAIWLLSNIGKSYWCSIYSI